MGKLNFKAPAINSKHVLKYYNFLRNGKVKKNKDAAKSKLILHFVRLGISIVNKFVIFYPKMSDLLNSEMLLAIVDGMDRISLGAIDHHEKIDPITGVRVPDPNLDNYISSCIRGRVTKAIANEIHIPSQLLDSNKCLDLRSGEAYRLLEMLEILDKSTKNEIQRRIIDLRIEGYSDEEIGKQLGTSKWTVLRIRNEVAERFLEISKLNVRGSHVKQRNSRRGRACV